MESQKRQEEWIQNVSTNITFIDYGNSCVGHRKAGFQIKIAVHFGMADYGDGFRTACVCSDESGNFGCRLVSDCRTCIGMCSRSYDRNGTCLEQNQTFRKIDCHHNTYAVTGNIFVVSLVFGVVFYLSDIPVYLAFIFGGIALATAPAPALSIVREFNTKGPVTGTLIPMAALDDIVGCIVFFTTIAIVAGNLSSGELPTYMIALVVILPLIIGAVTGFFAGMLLKREQNAFATMATLIGMILVTSAVGFVFNHFVMPSPVLNFMLMGMAFSAAFSNMVTEERLEQIMHGFNPILGIAMIIVILNLGAPLDYHLILGAGMFTAIYIIARAAGKYFGAYFGANVTKSPESVKKYLGLTLLPHSGVSLVFTGIAVSVLAGPAPDCAKIIQGTIAAAAVINEIIAVIAAKKGFEWAGEMQ